MKLFSRGKKIGIIGGTFNPIHIGHLRSAEEVREAFRLERVIFIPSASPPHKDKGNIIDASHRYNMVRLAVAKNPNFVASDIEIKRRGTSYTVDTLRYIRKKGVEGMNIYFILGIDAFLEIETWKSYESLFEMCDWVVITRAGFDSVWGMDALPQSIRKDFRYDPASNRCIHKSGRNVSFRRFRALDISSTEIRTLVREGRSIRFLVPNTVESYIFDNHLYESDKEESKEV